MNYSVKIYCEHSGIKVFKEQILAAEWQTICNEYFYITDVWSKINDVWFELYFSDNEIYEDLIGCGVMEFALTKHEFDYLKLKIL